MLRRIVSSTVIVLVTAASAGAQDIPRRVVPARPDWWVGISYGLMQAGMIDDAASNSTWVFGYTSQWAATLDKSFGPTTLAGLSVGFATAPLNYEPHSNVGATPSCFAGCSGNADVTQVLFNLQYTGGRFFGSAFHNVAALNAGATQFGNFRDSSGARMPNTGGAWDPSFGLRYGLGFYLADWSDVYLAEQWSMIMHHQPSGQVATFPPRTFTTTVGVRIGF